MGFLYEKHIFIGGLRLSGMYHTKTSVITSGIGWRIYEWRMVNEISRNKMAKDIKVSYSLLWELETGRRNVSHMRISTIERLAEYMNVRPGWLLWGE